MVTLSQNQPISLLLIKYKGISPMVIRTLFGGQKTKKKAAPKKGKSEMVVFILPAKRRSMPAPASPFDEAILDPLGCAVLGCISLPHAGDEMNLHSVVPVPPQWHQKSDRNLSLTAAGRHSVASKAGFFDLPADLF